MLFIAFVCGFLGITSADPFKEDLVYPELLQERSESGELLLRIQDTTLHLKKSSVLAHDLFLDTSDGDESEYTLWNGTSLEENLYHDSEHQSSIMLHQDDGAVKVEGMLSPSWRIAPLSSIERSEDAAVPHRIYRIADTDHRNDLAFRDLTINIPVFRKRGQKKFDRVPPRQKLPEEYVAEIYLISDRRHEKPFTTDKELISYLAVMMNAINIWYEGMTEPKIRTKIVGVSRCKTSSNDVKVGKFLYGAPTLKKLTDYVNKKWPRDSDAVYVFTGQNMGDVDSTGKPKGNLLGIARKSSLCTELNVGMGEDTPGTFRGAHIAAHEIAHILGSSHDGGVGDPLIQKQGGDLCSWEDGYLMSYKDGGRKKYQLSRCSKSQIRRLISTVSDKCLEETSQLSMRTQRNILPGQIITAEDYCRGILASKGRGVPLLLPKDLSKCRMQCCLQPPYGGGFCQKEFVPNGMRCAPGKCTLDKTVWNLVYRNYYDDAHFGSVKCATFRDLRNFKDYFTSIRSDKNGTFNSSEKIVLKSSPGYTAKNLIQSKSDGKNGTVEVNVIYTDCQKCIVLRHPYANDGYGCTYWRRFDTIKEQTDGCEFIYDELCGTVPKYRTYTSTCTPKTFVIVPDLPSKPWDWSLLSKLLKFLKDLLPSLKLPSLSNTGKPPIGLTISL